MKIQKKKFISNNKGITLVELVVTIIVLLILAAVSIDLVLGDNGIFINANKAKTMSEKESEKEIIKLAMSEVVFDGNIENVRSELNKNNAELINYNPTIVKFNNSNKYYSIDSDGNVNDLEYEDSIYKYMLSGELKVGDYIEYGISNYKDDGLYTIPKELSGADENQTVDAKRYNGKWRILYDGKTEAGFQIISETDVLGGSDDDKIALRGKVGYNNSVEILNTFAGYYLNKDYAVSARSLGSKSTDTEVSKGHSTIVKDVDIKSMFHLRTWELEQVQDYKLNDDDYIEDMEQVKKLNHGYRGALASRYIIEGYHYGSEIDFCLRNYYDRYELALVNDNEVYIPCSGYVDFIPVIRLKDNLKIRKVEGVQNTTWKIIE